MIIMVTKFMEILVVILVIMIVIIMFVYNGARDAVWRCCDCDFTLPALQIASQEKDVTMDLGSIARDDVRGLEDFLARHKQLLHHNHAAMMEVRI